MDLTPQEAIDKLDFPVGWEPVPMPIGRVQRAMACGGARILVYPTDTDRLQIFAYSEANADFSVSVSINPDGAADALARVLWAVDVLLMAGDGENGAVLPQDQRKCADGLTPCRCADRALVRVVGGLDGKQEGGVNG